MILDCPYCGIELRFSYNAEKEYYFGCVCPKCFGNIQVEYDEYLDENDEECCYYLPTKTDVDYSQSILNKEVTVA